MNYSDLVRYLNSLRTKWPYSCWLTISAQRAVWGGSPAIHPSLANPYQIAGSGVPQDLKRVRTTTLLAAPCILMRCSGLGPPIHGDPDAALHTFRSKTQSRYHAGGAANHGGVLPCSTAERLRRSQQGARLGYSLNRTTAISVSEEST